MRRAVLASILGIVALAAVPASGQATSTIGVNLAAVSPGNNYNCSAVSDCTLLNSLLGAPFEAPDGSASRVNGTITSWQLKTGAGGASAVRLRVLRSGGPLTSAGFTGAGSSPQVNAPPFSVTSFPASLPIRRDDLIGFDCCQSGNDSVNSPNASFAFVWGNTGLGPLADGSTRISDGFTNVNSGGVMVNATIQTDESLEILTKPRLRKGKVRMKADVPNPGSMDLAAKGGLLRRSSGYYDDVGIQEISLALTDEGRALLREGGRLKAKIKVLYRPLEGDLVRRKVRASFRR
jgi:hypothetical protein